MNNEIIDQKIIKDLQRSWRKKSLKNKSYRLSVHIESDKGNQVAIYHSFAVEMPILSAIHYVLIENSIYLGRISDVKITFSDVVSDRNVTFKDLSLHETK